MLTYFGCVIPPRLALSVNQKAAELLDLDLSCEVRDYAGRNFGEVIEETAEKSPCRDGWRSRDYCGRQMLIHDAPVPVIQVK